MLIETAQVCVPRPQPLIFGSVYVNYLLHSLEGELCFCMDKGTIPSGIWLWIT